MKKNAIAICGAICSGKSSITDCLAKSHQWSIISFGNYVRHVANIKNLSPSRKTYQNLGQNLITTQGAQIFLNEVVEFNNPSSNTHLFDGIRHLSIIEAIRSRYEKTFVVFLNISDQERYKRFVARDTQADLPIKFEEFLFICNQPVEQEIAAISRISDIIIDASNTIPELVAIIEGKLFHEKF